MRFELTPEIIDQIIFSMENQETPFVFDSETRTVLDPTGRSEITQEEEGVGTARYVDIPGWSSADGFQLMERFVATLRNPLVREKLRAALSGGKGVFRNFKNTLKAHEEVERLWFSYKDREMRSKVVDWYNDLCDLWGWERLSREPDDEEATEELVLSDFAFSEAGAGGAALIDRYDREAWVEAFTALPSAMVSWLYERARVDTESDDGQNLVISATTPGGEFAGFIWGREESGEATEEEPSPVRWIWIAQIYVAREFRGLGIAKALVDHLCRAAYARGVNKVLAELCGSAEVLFKPLVEQGFSSIAQGLILDLDDWGLENEEP